MIGEAQKMRQLWRTVLHHALLDWRKEWLKASEDRRAHVVAEVRRYFASRDAREVVSNAGWEFGPRWAEQAIAAITAPPGDSIIDDRRRWAE